MCGIRLAIRKSWIELGLRTRSFLLIGVIIFSFRVSSFAQATFYVGSTPVTAAIKTGQTEPVGDITLTVAPAGGVSAAGMVTAYYSGVPITSTLSTANNIVATGGLAGATVNLAASSNASGILVVNIPAGGSVGDTLRVNGIRVAVANSGLTSVAAGISSVGNAIAAGQTLVTVISSMPAGLAAISGGTAGEINGNTGAITRQPVVVAKENFLNAFRSQSEPDTTSVMVRVTLDKAPPSGITVQFPAQATASDGSVWQTAAADGTTLNAAVSFTSSSTSLAVHYESVTETSPFSMDTLSIPVTLSVSGSATLPLAATTVQYTESLAPIGTAFGPSGSVITSPIPRFVAAEVGPATLFVITNPSPSFTVTTDPAGRSFNVDGVNYTSSQTFSWAVGSSHTIATTSPQGSGCTQYVWSSWSDGGAMSHAIATPASATTYTANFTTQYQLTTNVSPANAGSITASPTSPDGYYNSGTPVQLTAVVNAGCTFGNWSGDLTGSSNPQSVTMSACRSVTASFLPQITITTNPAGRSFTVDGTNYTSAQTFSWAVGSSHTIATTTPQGTGGTRYVFGDWSDGGAMSHGITVAASAATYTAKFTTQYLVTAKAFPDFGGSVKVSPASTDGYFDSGSSVQLSAVPNSGYVFLTWGGDLTGATNPQGWKVSAPMVVTANFAAATQAIISSLNPAQVTAGGAGFTLTVIGSKFVSGCQVYWNGVAQRTSFANSSQVTASIDSVSIAFPGSAAVTVVNAGGIASNSLSFTINPAPSPTPVITSISPVSGMAGGPGFDLQVYGSDFVPESIVRWNGSDRSTTFLSSRQLRAAVPAAEIAAPAVVGVTVASPGGVTSNPVSFTLSSPVPVLTAVSPPAVITGSPDFELTVYGLNFDPECTVQWNGAARPTSFVTSSMLTASISGADASADGTGSVTVAKAGSASSSPQTLQILTLSSSTPSITQVIPDPIPVGGPGLTLRVLGSGFVSGCRVQWNGQSRETTFVSANEVQAAIPASDMAKAGVYSIIVTKPAALAEAGVAAEADAAPGTPIGISKVVNPAPTIQRFSQSSATAGDSGLGLVIEGEGFLQNATYVQWNNIQVLANYISSTRISAGIPASDLAKAGTINFVVSNPSPGGGDSDSRTFTVTPREATVTELYFPRLVSSLEGPAQKSQNTGIAVASLSNTQPVMTLRAYDRLGVEIAGPEITNPVSFALSGMEQRAVVGSQVFGPGMAEQNTIGWMKLQSPEKKVAGFFLAFDNGLSTLDGADVSSSTLTSFVFPEIEGEGFNQLHVANPNQGGATVTFELYKSDGTLRTSPVVRNLNANGAVGEYVTELFPGVTVTSGDYVRVSSNRGVVPFSYFGRAGHDAAGINGQDATKGSAWLYSPQYVAGDDMSTTLSVVNLDSTSANVTFRLIGDDGTPIGATRVMSIPGKGKAAVTEQDFFVNAGDQLVSGYVEVKSDGARLAGSVVFGDLHRDRFTSALPLVSSLQSTIIFGQVASGRLGDWDYFTGIAMLNPSDMEANATLEVYSREGKQVAIKTETIPAWRRKTQLLTEYFPALNGQAVGGGYIKITSSRGLASFALFGPARLTALSAVPAQTVP